MEEKVSPSKTDFVLKCLLIISIVLNIVIVLSSVFVVTEVTGVEDNVIHTIQTILADNRQLYTNPEAAPYAITQYAPLHYIICDSVLTIFGIGADAAPFLIKIISRIISLLFVLLCIYVLRKIFLEHAGITNKEANILLLAFVSFTAPWLYIAKPDVLVTFFSILAIYLSFNYFSTRQYTAIFLTGIVCFLAFFSKQNGAFMVGAVAIFLLAIRDLKGIALFTLGVVSGALAGFLLLELMHYNSAYLYANIIKGIDNGRSMVAFVRVMNGISAKYGIFIILCFIGSIALLRSCTKRIENFTQYLFYFLFFVAIAVSFKIGSSENYFLDFLMAGLLIWALFIRKFLYQEEYRVLKQWVLLVLLVATVSIGVRNIFQFGFSNAYDWHYYLTHKEAYKATDEFIKNELEEGAYFYSDDVHIQLMSPKKIMFPHNDIIVCCAHPLATFSYQNFANDVKSGKLKFIISFKPLHSIYGAAAFGEISGTDLEHNFALYKVIGDINVFRNKHAD